MSAKATKKLTPSLEDYLEAIFVLIRQGGVARVRDIAGRLGVGMPSVTAALKTLSRRELVNYDPYEFITLSDRGRDAAEQISRRHDVLRVFLMEVLGLPASHADARACCLEHAVDDRLLERLCLLNKFLRRNSPTGGASAKAFEQFLKRHTRRRAAKKEDS